ncbi:thiolase family protein [Novosphingobium album (ex Liu et al. 2023)]|uniref:Thiolase family protein n=1 Tax=Novosphingobium album (ex Liu et al. 2023) TaxID=3031130 RepID=A0ABT5WRP2_9SPHN|nr:thiolase family protein [Novosphingobium album (ex Liu et al. 2023)]MDE8652716.1 thiolase family protein [Novosphingobium album (ex Liu et al. 2023)]
MTDLPEKLTCITGAGQSEVGRPSSRTALQLTADACLQAIADAGLKVSDIDGVATYPGKSAEGGGIAPVSPAEAAAVLGIDPRWILASGEGFSHMAPIFNAITAIACGLARHVVIFRTVAQATARLASRQSTLMAGERNARIEGNNAWTVPFNALSPINTFALYAQAYFDKYGATSEQLGAIAVNSRRNAAHNPNAIYRKPLSLEDYLASRVISSPLRLFDCDSHIDGSTAIVVSHRDAASDLRNPPLHIEAMGMAMGGLWVGKFAGDFTHLAADKAGAMLWSRTDLTPGDVDCAQIYDGFSIHVWLWLEALGMVGRGEAAAFVEGGRRIAIDGELPLNTGGGQLSAGRFHGYGHIHEATVQLWGRGGGRQVQDARTCLISNGGYGYGAMLLRRD